MYINLCMFFLILLFKMISYKTVTFHFDCMFIIGNGNGMFDKILSRTLLKLVGHIKVEAAIAINMR